MHEHISIVLTAHKSKDLIINYIKNLYQKFHIIVIDNSNDIELEKEIFLASIRCRFGIVLF